MSNDLLDRTRAAMAYAAQNLTFAEFKFLG